MTQLIHQKCVPCEGGTAPLTNAEEDVYHEETSEWQIHREGVHRITREFSFSNFSQALQFVIKVGEIAESESHHPNISLHDFKKVTIELYTHAIGGLSVNDFIVASKLDQLLTTRS